MAIITPSPILISQPNRNDFDPRPLTHVQRVQRDLRNLGASPRCTLSFAGRYLPSVIHAHEQIRALVYGRSNGIFAMLVATDRRIIFLEKKFLFVDEDEISYYMVGGVSYSKAGIGSTVTLHTRVKDFVIKTLNGHCAGDFVAYIESRCLERLNGGRYDQYPKERNVQTY